MDPTNPMGLGAILATSAGASSGAGHLDALARARGFQNAAQMAAFYHQQQLRTGQNGSGDNSGGMMGMAADAINHPSQAINQGTSWRPSSLFDYILGKMNAVMP